MTCECGKPAHPDRHVWNGMHLMPVCEDCWRDPENIVLEACVQYATDAAAFNPPTLEEAMRVELGFREEPWTPELQALCDARYLEWYFEPAY
jgi:hypothetical protein